MSFLQQWQSTIVKGGLAGDTSWQFMETLKNTSPDDEYDIEYSVTERSDYGNIVMQHVKAMTGKSVGGSFSIPYVPQRSQTEYALVIDNTLCPLHPYTTICKNHRVQA